MGLATKVGRGIVYVGNSQNVNFEVNLVHQGLKNNNKNIVLSLWSDCSEQLLLLDFENEKHIQLRLHMWTIFRLGESNFGTKAYGS